MSEKRDDGGLAFPLSVVGDSLYEQSGMTLRDWFASQALQCLFVCDDEARGWLPSDAAQFVYAIADAMLKERSK